MSESQTEYAVSVERVTEIQRRLAVEIPWTQVKEKLDAAYDELSKGVAIKGFRRGKVPRRLLQQMFGQHVNKEVAQQLVQESMAKAVTDNELSPVSAPEVEPSELVDGESFRYSALLQVLPEVDPKDYAGLEVPRRPARVTDADVERALEEKRREHTVFKAIEGRRTAAGDVLIVDVLGKLGDEPISIDKAPVTLTEPPREPVPGLAARLLDLDPTTRELELEYEVPPQADAEGGATTPRQARLLVTLVEAHERIVPELDDELAKDTGEAETIDGLRDKLRQDLLEIDERRCLQEARQTVLSLALERNDVPLVPLLVEKQIEQMTQLKQLFEAYDVAGFLSDEALREQAERTVRSGILVRAIAKKENVEVDDADVEQHLARMAEARGQSVARLRAEHEREGRLDQLRASIREEKTLDLLLSKSTLVVREPEEAKGPEDDAARSEPTIVLTDRPDDR